MGRPTNHEGQRRRRIISVELTDREVEALRSIRDHLERTGKVRKRSTISAALRFAIRIVANYVRRLKPKEDDHGEGT